MFIKKFWNRKLCAVVKKHKNFWFNFGMHISGTLLEIYCNPRNLEIVFPPPKSIFSLEGCRRFGITIFDLQVNVINVITFLKKFPPAVQTFQNIDFLKISTFFCCEIKGNYWSKKLIQVNLQETYPNHTNWQHICSLLKKNLCSPSLFEMHTTGTWTFAFLWEWSTHICHINS